jgi:hypothetical protein
MMLRNWLQRAGRELGFLGIAGLAIIAGATALDAYGLRPLQARGEAADTRLARQLAHERASDAKQARDAAPASKLAAFYRFFETAGKPAESLDKLSAIASASGVELRSADYRMQKTGSRIERYEITLPLSGSYAQVRAFLQKALADIPVLSLDQISFKRNSAGEPVVQAEARLTLHVVAENAK